MAPARRAFVPAAALLGALGGACEPAFDRPPHLVDQARLLGARAEPAELAPGETATLTFLVAAPEGTLAHDEIEVALCRRPREVAENAAAAPECLAESAPWIEPVARPGAGDEVDVRIPGDACALFGSEPAPAPSGEPPRRPVDPDLSGGYYQPVRVRLAGAGGAVAFARVRLLCALPGAPADVAREFRARYRPNRNPELLELAAPSVSVAPGAELLVTARFAPDARESYLRYDPAAARLENRQETLELSWFTTAGLLERDRTAPDPGAAASENRFTAPAEPGPVTLWAVLRDDRGGASFTELTLTVAAGR